MGEIADLLQADHRRLAALLDGAVAGLDGAVAGPDGFDHEAFAAFRAGLLRHIALEEKIFYAEARRRSKEVGARTAPLRREHGALTSLLVPTPDRALVEEIRSILTPHDALEEGDGGVYAACEAVLDDHAAVIERMRAYPAVPVAAHFDGPAVPRTAAAALAVAARQKVSRGG